MNERLVSTYPARLGELAPVLRRRQIGIGVDRRGQPVLARPDSIQVDFGGDDDRRRQVLDLVAQVPADNADVLERDDTEDEVEGSDVLTVRVAPEVDGSGVEERWSLAPLDAALSRFRAAGVRAELNHVVFGAASTIPSLLGGAVLGASAPASSATAIMTPENKAALITTATPTVAPRFLRERLNLDGYRRPRVLVLDTGLRTADGAGTEPEHAFLKAPEPASPRVHIHPGWRSDPAIDAVDDEDEADDDRSGLLDFEAGHGTFIAGVVAQICPDAEIHPAGVLSSFGEGCVGKVRLTIRRMNRLCGPFDIVVMSFGAYCADDDPGMFGADVPRLLGDAVGVAAAGNLRSCRPYFPAALSGVVGVGGLERGGGAAWFTNFGQWVDACAPAVDVVSTFFDDVTECFPGRPLRRFQEWARWSGTSFAAPKVAGAIAQEMYLNQVSAREAWHRLSTPDRLRIPDVGVVVNV